MASRYIPNEILEEIVTELTINYSYEAPCFNEYRAIASALEPLRKTSRQLAAVSKGVLERWIVKRLPILQDNLMKLKPKQINPRNFMVRPFVDSWRQACSQTIDRVLSLVDTRTMVDSHHYRSRFEVLEETIAACEDSGYAIEKYSSAYFNLENTYYARTWGILKASRKAHEILKRLDMELDLRIDSDFLALNMRDSQMNFKTLARRPILLIHPQSRPDYDPFAPSDQIW